MHSAADWTPADTEQSEYKYLDSNRFRAVPAPCNPLFSSAEQSAVFITMHRINAENVRICRTSDVLTGRRMRLGLGGSGQEAAGVAGVDLAHAVWIGRRVWAQSRADLAHES